MSMSETPTVEPVPDAKHVTNTVLVPVKSLALVNPLADETAEILFRELYKGKKLTNVTQEKRVFNVGVGVEYTFSADHK